MDYHARMDRPVPIIDVQLLDEPVRALTVDPFPQPAGAECVFLGRSRAEEHPEHGALVKLRYEAYRPMAERVLLDLAGRAADRFECLAVRLHHALGDVPLGEASVLVQVVCGHRAEAFEACRYLIDALKAEAPIWKREHWADGTTWSEGAPVSVPEAG
jgi:molybdopterin synthase catalytic subunit